MAHLPPRTFVPSTNELVPRTRKIDLRPEDEIVAQILSHRPVTREKNVWAYWDKGWDAMRPWTKRNIVDWVRILGPEWDVRVLDNVAGSPRHVSHFIDEKMLPPRFREMDGRHAGHHTSDIVRVMLLYLYGGAWMDVGGVMVRHLDDVCWNRIVDPEDPVQVVAIASGVGDYVEDRPLINGFLAARKGNEFMRHWHTVFSATIGDRLNFKGIRNDPLTAHLVPFEKPARLPIEVAVEDAADYIAQWHSAGRLVALVDPESGWDGPKFFQENLLLLRLGEIFMQNILSRFDGEIQFKHLSLSRRPGADEEQRAAEQFVETVLARSTMVKLSQGLFPKPVQLATIWDRPENENADVAPGTWAEYFRWASVHLEPRNGVDYLSKEEMVIRRPKRVWTAGIVDVIDSSTPVRNL